MGERAVDLNADLGEGVTDDSGLLQIVTSANVACGYHAGDVATMRKVCQEASARGVTVGAQVSYADREGFGRRPRDVAYAVLRAQVAEQVRMLQEAAQDAGTTVGYLKPHGALYHRVLDDPEQARAVLDGSEGLPVLGMSGALLTQARVRGRRVVLEGFPDRGYGEDGRLLPRAEPGAMVTDPDDVARNTVRLAGAVESLCVHGDAPGAVASARAIRDALEEAGFVVRSFA